MVFFLFLASDGTTVQWQWTRKYLLRKLRPS